MATTKMLNDIPLIDTHSHLDSDQFDGIRATIMENTQQAGIEKMISIGCSWGSSQKCLYLTSVYSNVYAAVGIHPNYTSNAAAGHWDRIVEMTKPVSYTHLTLPTKA